MSGVGVQRSRRAALPLRHGSGRVAAIRACVTDRDFGELRTALVDVVLNAVQPGAAAALPAASSKLALGGAAPALTAATSVQVSLMPAAPAATAATVALADPAHDAGAETEAEAPATVVLEVAPRARPWRAKASGRRPEAARQLQLDLSGLVGAAVAWEEERRLVARRAAEAAAAAAAAEAAAAAAAAAAALAAAAAEAKTPAPAAAAAAAAAAAGLALGAPTPGASTWSPIEGVPELRSRPRRRQPAPPPPPAAATPPAAIAFTPVEGVPETARGFRRPQPSASARPPAPRFDAAGEPSVAAPVPAPGGEDDWSDGGGGDDGGYGDDFGDGGGEWGGAGGADGARAAAVAAARQHVSSVVQGITLASPETPIHPLQLATSGTTGRRTASRTGGRAASGPSPLHLTPAAAGEGGAAAGDGEAAGAAAAAGPSRKRKYPAQTPREGRWAKSRKSLASDGTRIAADGRRQSSRVRHKPLEYWRNEAKEMCRVHQSLPTVKRITERTPDPAWPAPHAELLKRQAARSKPRSKAAAAK
ncbi:hypothetical protein Rsub_04594 [Raphidocelis subcapitata]|uniref:Uncharacterized protein n=1 Tax=Raphidocelis subcapitata TaxID=307507 RepID=A0A2V0P3R6_9CHLO|nr:hypothetical protein Rsub_04594 [Raphidocelis subcapitata]|eukprot:GBF92490.1 hypothetical protein Rsub_04594 [Raphidocelis subcapitata]